MGKEVTRRKFVQGITLSSVISALPRTARTQNSTQVLIIGAGLSGLSAALILEEQGVNVQVIEARNEAGGRLKSLRNVPGIAELGGKAFGKGYARLIDTADKLDVPYAEIPKSPLRQLELALGNHIISPKEWPDHPQNVLPTESKQLMPWSYFMRFMMQHMGITQPGDWIDPTFAHLDISFDAWMLKKGAPSDVIDLCCNMNWDYNNSTHDVSALVVMFEMLWGQQVFRANGKMQSFSFEHGNQSLPFAMEAALNQDIHYKKEVVSIDMIDGKADIRCRDGSRYSADHVISSVPIPILRHISVTPGFTGVQRKAIATLPRRMVTHVHLVPKKPFWEKDGWKPAMKIGNAPINFVWPYYTSKNPDHIEHLLASITGQAAARANQMDHDSVKAMVIETIETIRPAAKGMLDVVSIKSWFQDPFTGGDWSSFGPGQVMPFAGPMHAANKRLHLCGDGTALSARGMEGAMESAERVAVEVLDRL